MNPRTQRMLVFVVSSSVLMSGCCWGWGRGRGGHHRWSDNSFDSSPRQAPSAHPVAVARATPSVSVKPFHAAPQMGYGVVSPRIRVTVSDEPVSAVLNLVGLFVDAALDAHLVAMSRPPPEPAFAESDVAGPVDDDADEPMPPAPDFYGADFGSDICADVAPGSPAPRGCAKFRASGSDAAGSTR